MEVDHPLGLGEAARVRGVRGHLRLGHVVAEPLEDPAEEARAAPARASDEDERPLRLAPGRLLGASGRVFRFLRNGHCCPDRKVIWTHSQTAREGAFPEGRLGRLA